MKNIIKLFIILVFVFNITGCGKKNTLTCSGDYVLSMGMIEKSTNATYNDDDEDEEKSEIVFDQTEGNVGEGKYTFTFDDEKIIKLELKETLNEDLSNDIKLDGKEEVSEGCYAEKIKGKVVLKCSEGEDSFLANVLNRAGYGTKEELKEFLGKETSLTCK